MNVFSTWMSSSPEEDEVMMMRSPTATTARPGGTSAAGPAGTTEDEVMQLRSPMAAAKDLKNSLMDMSMESSMDDDTDAVPVDEQRQEEEQPCLHDDDISAVTMEHEDHHAMAAAAAAATTKSITNDAREDVPADEKKEDDHQELDACADGEDMILSLRSNDDDDNTAEGQPPFTPSAVTNTEHRRKIDMMEECGEIEVEYFSQEEQGESGGDESEENEDIISTEAEPALSSTEIAEKVEEVPSMTGVPSDEDGVTTGQDVIDVKVDEVKDQQEEVISQADITLENKTWSFDTTMKTRKKKKKSQQTTAVIDVEQHVVPPVSLHMDDLASPINEAIIEEETSEVIERIRERAAQPAVVVEECHEENETEQVDDLSIPIDEENIENEEETSEFVDCVQEMAQQAVAVEECQEEEDATKEDDVDPDDANSDCDNTENRMGGNDLDSILENIGEDIESRNWDKFIETITAHPSLAALSSVDFFPMKDSSVVSGFMDVDSEKNLLLHEICKNDPTVDAVKAVVDLHEVAVKLPGQWGHLPLHHACASGASETVVQYLLMTYPEAASITSDLSMLPLHIACK
eukprot:CAMPEP_0113448192 /NCGR_PEP_ID=MMETSP0014_2-20120614/4635_1 /TAXON_ID=2857 /ORGANISM="Nitzschia sp." /LENGTH=576 /DNA_ID=CAMNT_0000339387 /DNA_START=117 /DNA_END=1844 /DNA_ORIENTATION=+ /assembly_acc=CAM_ASM_000159